MRKQHYQSNAAVSGGPSHTWRQCCFLLVLSVLLAGSASAQFFHKISFEDATDCPNNAGFHVVVFSAAILGVVWFSVKLLATLGRIASRIASSAFRR